MIAFPVPADKSPIDLSSIPDHAEGESESVSWECRRNRNTVYGDKETVGGGERSARETAVSEINERLFLPRLASFVFYRLPRHAFAPLPRVRSSC